MSTTTGGVAPTILLAEDQALLRELGQTILSQAGYKVVTAPGESELRSLLSDYPEAVDLLLTDVLMPGLSGQELAHLARKRWPEIRVIYMSGYPDHELENLLGDAAFLQKPFTPSELMAKVKELIGNGRV
jgi:two-component system, cell cycle sensor histidine kinase and response regulator CckA